MTGYWRGDFERMKINRKLFYILIAVMYLCVFAAGTLFFFGGRDFSTNQKENSFLIGASYMTMNNEFYKIISEEISERVDAEGGRLIFRDPALDIDRQREQIGDMIDMGIDLLIVTPVSFEGLTDVLKRARREGVYVVVLDSNVKEEELVDCTIVSDNYNAGVLVGEYFLKQHGQSETIVMTHEATKSGRDRVQGFLDTVARNKNIKIVKKIECEGQVETAMPKLQKVIDEGVPFDSVFCLNDLAGVGVVAALDNNQMAGKVGVYGVDASPDAKALIAEGMMQASAAQFPTEIGKRAADVVYRLLQGRNVEKEIHVPVKLITGENVEEFGIDRWQ